MSFGAVIARTRVCAVLCHVVRGTGASVALFNIEARVMGETAVIAFIWRVMYGPRWLWRVRRVIALQLMQFYSVE